MAYDPTGDNVVVFGGRDPFVLGDTWIWNGTQWNQVAKDAAPGSVPSARYGAAMAWDGHEIVLFGGLTVQGVVGDTWIWNGLQWNRVDEPDPKAVPSARFHAAMTYDANVGKVVLFGGGNDEPTSAMGDTWQWDGSPQPGVGPGHPMGWSLFDAGGPGRPIGRSNATMAYDGARKDIVLFGGAGPTGDPVGDTQTWLWNNGWTAQQAPSQASSGTCTRKGNAVTSLTPRYGDAMAFDEVTNKVVMFGGFVTDATGITVTNPGTGGQDAVHQVDETWTWDGSSWAYQDPCYMTLIPGARYGAATATNPGPIPRTVMLFGGLGSDFFADTWTWDGTTPPTAGPTPSPLPSTPLSPPSQTPTPVPVTTTPSPPAAASTAPAPTPASPPRVHHVVPPSGSVSGGDSRVMVGSGFTAAPVTAVSFGGKAATSFSVVDDAHIRVVTPAHGAGTVDVTVTTSAGTTSPVLRPPSSAVDDDEYTFFPPSPFAAGPNGGGGAGTFNQNQSPRPVPPGGLGAVPAPGGGFAPGVAAGFLSPAGAPPPALAAGPPLEPSQVPGAAVHHNMTRARDEGGPAVAWAGVGAGGILLLCSCFGRRRPSDPDVRHVLARGRAQAQRA